MLTWLAGIVKSLLTSFGIYLAGRKVQAEKDATKAAETKAANVQTRLEVENEIHDDTDLLARARRSGFLRHDDAE